MYESRFELPSQVQASLNEDDCKEWMEAYNKAIKGADNPTPKDIMAARRAAWFSVKDAPSSFSFCIKAAADSVDITGEVMTVDTVKKRLDSFIEYGGNINWDHQNYNIGVVWGWEPIRFESEHGDMVDGVQVWGNLFGGDLVYDEARKRFTEGMNSLSIGGEADNKRFVCDEKGCYTKRDVRQLLEISLTSHPANKDATLVWYNKDASFTKSSDGLRLSISEYTIHKSETECPILMMKKQLRALGLDAHARKGGCFIKCSSDDVDDVQDAVRGAGFDLLTPAIDDLGQGLYVHDYESFVKSKFKQAYSNGWVDKDGIVTDSVPKSFFKSLYSKGVICRDCGIYRIRYHT